MSTSRRARIRERARRRCEYCHIPESPFLQIPFQVDHVKARQHSGPDDPANLCWSCQRCNSRKGTKLSAVDPLTGDVVRVFHPRRQQWSRHFLWVRLALVGRTRVGRATVALLDMNDDERLKLRQRLHDLENWTDPE